MPLAFAYGCTGEDPAAVPPDAASPDASIDVSEPNGEVDAGHDEASVDAGDLTEGCSKERGTCFVPKEAGKPVAYLPVTSADGGAADAGVACPDDFADPKPAVANPSATGMCHCGAGSYETTKPPFCSGTMTWGSGTCSPNTSIVTSKACTPMASVQDVRVKLSGVTPDNGACKSQPADALPAVSADRGQRCNVAPAVCDQRGCTVAFPSGSPRLCLEPSKAGACPAPFTAQVRVGTDVQDARTCAMCTYTPKPFDCDGVKIQFYQSTTCTSGPTVQSAATTCSALGSGDIADGAKLVPAGPPPGCTAPPDILPAGDVTLISEETLCCVP